MAQHMGGEAITGKEVPPMPIRWSAWAVYETYDTSDGDKVFIGITSDNHWRRFCEHFDRPDMLNDPTLATNEDRVAARDRVKPFVAEVIGRHTMADTVRICEDIGIPFAPVARTKNLNRQRGGSGKVETVRVNLGVRRIIKKKN